MLRYMATFDTNLRNPLNDVLAAYFVPPLFAFFTQFSWTRSYLVSLTETAIPGLYPGVVARAIHFDTVIKKLINEHSDIRQFVNFGSGYDARPFRFHPFFQDKNVTIFELDLPTIMDKKLPVLKNKLPHLNDITETIRYTSTNFNNKQLETDLRDAKFDPTLKSVFLWEGVVSYLEPDSVSSAIQFLRSLTPPGSFLLFDMFPIPSSVLGSKKTDKSPVDEMKAAPQDYEEFLVGCYGLLQLEADLEKLNEPDKFALWDYQFRPFFREHGYQIVGEWTPRTLEDTYLIRKDGSSLGRVACYNNVFTAKAVHLESTPTPSTPPTPTTPTPTPKDEETTK